MTHFYSPLKTTLDPICVFDDHLSLVSQSLRMSGRVTSFKNMHTAMTILKMITFRRFFVFIFPIKLLMRGISKIPVAFPCAPSNTLRWSPFPFRVQKLPDYKFVKRKTQSEQIFLVEPAIGSSLSKPRE